MSDLNPWTEGLSRYAAILEERGLVPFQREPWVNPETGRVDGRVLGKRLPLRWHVGRAEWNRLLALQTLPAGTDSEIAQQLGGWPIEPDDSLPPTAIVLTEDSR